MTAQDPGAIDRPIQHFSGCHAGMVSMLDDPAPRARLPGSAAQRSAGFPAAGSGQLERRASHHLAALGPALHIRHASQAVQHDVGFN